MLIKRANVLFRRTETGPQFQYYGVALKLQEINMFVNITDSPSAVILQISHLIECDEFIVNVYLLLLTSMDNNRADSSQCPQPFKITTRCGI